MAEQKIQAVKLKTAMVAGLSALNEIEIEFAAKQIDTYIAEHKPQYLMMLNHEVRYFTVFDMKGSMIHLSNGKEIIAFIKECVEPVYGNLKLIDADSTQGAIEVWCGETCFILFDYSNGVVKL